MEGYEEDFLSKEEGSSRSAVKRMTRKLELEMMKLTINAPDW
jgi:glycerol-3-phosphate O-acyltransferase/dihydroxyacetone phosphate acyltransferase